MKKIHTWGSRRVVSRAPFMVVVAEQNKRSPIPPESDHSRWWWWSIFVTITLTAMYFVVIELISKKTLVSIKIHEERKKKKLTGRVVWVHFHPPLHRFYCAGRRRSSVRLTCGRCIRRAGGRHLLQGQGYLFLRKFCQIRLVYIMSHFRIWGVCHSSSDTAVILSKL